jgi:ribosome-associated protein
VLIDPAQLEPWIEFRFDRSSGPGGQNVNKLNTRATLLFDFEHADFLTADQRDAIRGRYARRLAADGRLRVIAQSGRSQEANRTAARTRLLELLEAVRNPPPMRRPTKPTAGSRRRRLEAKRRRSATKRDRSAGMSSE